VTCTAVTRTSIPGNSTSSIATAPIPGQSPRETFPQSRDDQGIHGVAARTKIGIVDRGVSGQPA
jgi:hypothetical protein